jgi:hypothetical protein
VCTGVVDSKDLPEERSRTDKMVDGMDFGELCNDFECISSPYVESTARQIARDILELRDDNRAFNCYAVSVKYKVLIGAHVIPIPSAPSPCYVKSFTFGFTCT